MARYIITRHARQDIDEILAYIAEDNLNAALTFSERLIERFQMLTRNSNAGRERSELGEGIRGFPEGNYVVFYRSWAANIAIVRVIHGSRDLDETFS